MADFARISLSPQLGVALNPRNSQLQNVKTLLHELAHAKLHTVTSINNYTKEEKEFQAEMTAFSVFYYFNIDTSEYSLSYLDHYTKNSDIKEKRHLLNEIKDTCKEFIEVIKDTLNKDIDITKDIDLAPIIDDSNTIDGSQTIADVINPTELIYVKFLWPENEYIQDDSIYTFNGANDFLNSLNELHKSNKELFPESTKGYEKTKFELHFDKNCTDRFYSGRFDIGDGFANDLREHIINV